MGSLSTADDAEALRMLQPGPEGFIDRLPDTGRVAGLDQPRRVRPLRSGIHQHRFHRTLNWYRCFDRNWELTATTPATTIDTPSLFIGGAADPTLAYTPRDRVREVVSGDYREVMIDDAGHWLQQERPAEVNEVLIDFLSGLELR